MRNTRDYNNTKQPSFTFAGCGFLGLYHVGVASCLREYAPINKATRIAGASAGALAAMALACDLPLGESTSEILQVAIKARSRALGPFHPSFDVNKIIYDGLVKTLPDDAHIKANGRLFISVTRISDGKNVIISQFKSKEELIKAIQCSCFIPIWSGLVPPKFNGIAYIDGGCSDNLPIVDENTVTISPFSGESDICPQDDTYNLFQFNLANTSIALTPANIYRITRILFPAHPEILSKMCQQGFDDALRYLQRNNKISCTRCLAIHFTLEKENNDDVYGENKKSSKKHDKHSHHDKHSLESCRDCEYRRQIAVLDSLPESVVQAIQEACDQVNKGLINWIFRHRPMKLLSILSIPYLLPIDITIVLLCKIYERLPDIKRELKDSLMRLVSFLRSLLVKMDSQSYFSSAKFSCQLAVKEFDYTSEENLKIPSRKPSSASTLPRKKSIQHKACRVEKANSFSGRKNSEFKPILGNEIKSIDNLVDLSQSADSERLRKTSYAGREVNKNSRPCYRRRSMVEMGNKVNMPPERVISQLNFDFKLDMKDSKSETQLDSPESLASSKSSLHADNKVLDIDLNHIDQNNAIEIANKALDWEKEFLEKCQRLGDTEGNFDKVFEITRNHDAVMAYYYTDENNKVKFTELFNITDDDLKKMETAKGSMTAYKDNDDGLVETPLPIASRTPVSSSLSSSLTSLNETPIKRQRKKSTLLVD